MATSLGLLFQTEIIGIHLSSYLVMLKPLGSTALLTLAACVVLVFLAGPGDAQEAPSPPRDSARSDSLATPGDSAMAGAQTLKPVRIGARRDSSGYSSGFTRSATKSPSLARDVPQSLVIVNSALVRDQGMHSMAEIVRYIPGISMGQGEGNRDQPTIRGNGTTADFFVDGVRDDAQYFRDVYNLERLEALKGSNAMVFGRGGGGGVLNRVTKEAHWISRHDAIAEAGTFGGRRVSTDLQQIVSPHFAARLNSLYENSRLFRDGVTLARSGFSPVFALSNDSRSTSLSFGYEYFRDRRTADRGIPSFQGKPVDADPAIFFGDPGQSFSRTTVNSATATLSHDAGRLQIRNHSRFGYYDKFYQNVFPGSVNASGSQVSLSAYNQATGRSNFFNQTDVTFSTATNGISHDLLLGAELGRQATDNLRLTGYFGGTATSVLVPVARPTVREQIAYRQSAADADNGTVVGTGSLYVQDQVSLSPRVRLLGGVRYEAFAIRFNDKRAVAERSRTDGLVSPRIGFVVKPSRLASIYANYSLSFLPGSGDQFASLTEVTRALRPERFANYEAGVKWDVLDRLALSAAVYRLDRTNTRAVDPAEPERRVQTGAQRSEGFEFSAFGNVTAGWEIAAGLARQSAKIISATATSPAGARVPLVPLNSFSLWNKYSITSRFGVALGAVSQSATFAAIDNKVTLPGFTRFDGALFAGIGWGLRAQVNVENILDDKYYATAHNNNNISPGSPRAARLTITARF